MAQDRDQRCAGPIFRRSERSAAHERRAKELDEEFNTLLHEAVYYSNARILHQLYRSRFRLLRGFSGLWLIYDPKSLAASS